MTVAVIGTGNLGRPVVERLLEVGRSVRACDREAARLEPLARLGAQTTTEPAACADCDVILAIVQTEAQLRGVAHAIAAARTGVAGHFAVLSTVPAQAVRETAALLAGSGLRVVDAPNSGGAGRAREGRLTIMAGGDESDIAALAPLFGVLASHVFHCGDLGAGQMVKIVNNILCHANSVLMGEALRLGMAYGLDPAALVQAMDVSTGRTWLTATPTLAAEVLGAQAPDRQVFAGILSILQKDMVIATDLSMTDAAGYPIIAGLARLIDGLGDETYQTWRQVAGLPPDPL